MSHKKITEQEQANKINTSLEELEHQRIVGIDKAQSLQRTKEKAQIRERQRLVDKYGPNHKRVRKIDRHLDSNPRLFQALDETKIRAMNKAPELDTKSWGIYGTVRDEQSQRLSGLTVSLFDDQGKWIQELGYTCTNDQGYYELIVEDRNERLVKRFQDKQLFLTLTNDQQKNLYEQADALSFTLGKFENYEIILPKEACGTPPDDDPDSIEKKYLIEGIVKDKSGNPQVGLHIKAVDQDFTGENPLGDEVITNQDGFYRIFYRAEDFIIGGKEPAGADIILFLSDAEGNLIHKSKVYRNSPLVATINLTIESKAKSDKNLE